ncbi:hypothetical protein EAG_11244 [Camponotus floridanus]|uniref:Uncharacterized protein n=1 Tax=Camponotus floridanus TaxID=104421 RepID=E2A0P9_CAMFO|nr:hypothetical protein EAG_11244 [Camponotus floridanus]
MLDSRAQKKREKKGEKERKRERGGPRQFAGSRLKKPKFRRDKASDQRDGANYIHGRRIEFSESDVRRDRIFREHVFAGDCGSRRDAGSVGVSRPCATGSGRANTETNPRHHHQPVSIHPSTHPLPPSTMPHPLLRRRRRRFHHHIIVTTTTTTTLPLPALFREPSDSLPFTRYPSPPPVPPSAVLVDGELHFLLLSSMPLYPPPPPPPAPPRARLPWQIPRDSVTRTNIRRGPKKGTTLASLSVMSKRGGTKGTYFTSARRYQDGPNPQGRLLAGRNPQLNSVGEA